MNRLVFLISMLFCMTFSAQAQELNDSVERRLVQPSRVFFVPHGMSRPKVALLTMWVKQSSLN